MGNFPLVNTCAHLNYPHGAMDHKRAGQGVQKKKIALYLLVRGCQPSGGEVNPR